MSNHQKGVVKSVYFSPELIEKIEALAQSQQRRWSEMIRLIVEDFFKQNP